MRIWSLHPKYLDPQGLVALWREALLAKAVLEGKTRGYTHHPQLWCFRTRASPVSAIRSYLRAVHAEAESRGYAFDSSKIGKCYRTALIEVTVGQLEHEWRHLGDKLKARSPKLLRKWHASESIDCHPSFRIVPGEMEAWER